MTKVSLYFNQENGVENYHLNPKIIELFSIKKEAFAN